MLIVLSMQNISKIQTLSQVMSYFCTLLIVALPCWTIWFWLNIDQFVAALSSARPNVLIDMQYIQTYQLALVMFISLSAVGLMMFGLWHLQRLFALFRTGTFFTSRAVSHLHVFTMVLFISAFMKPVVTALISLILTIGNPPGQKSLVLEFGSSDVSSIFIAGTLMVITWIMKEGQRLATENAEFV